MMIFVRPALSERIVTFDSAAGTNGGNGGSVTSLTWTQPVANADTGIIVLASYNALREISATCDGVAMTQLSSLSSATNNYLASFVLFGVSAGNKTIVITANTSVGRMQGQSASYTNATSFKKPQMIRSTTANATASSTDAPPLIMLLSNNGSAITAGTDTQLRNYQSSDTSNGPKGAILDGVNVVNATYTGNSSFVAFNVSGLDFKTAPGRVNKTDGTQTLANNGWRQITGWSVAPGYTSGTVVPADGLFHVGQSGTYTIIGVDQRLDEHSTTACRILVNGTVIATSESGGSVSIASFSPINLAADDIITLEGFTNTVGTASRQTGTIGTYIQIIPV